MIGVLLELPARLLSLLLLLLLLLGNRHFVDFSSLLVRYMSLSYWSSLVVPRPTGKDHQWTLGRSVPGQQHEDDSSRHCKPLLYEQNARNDRISARYNLFFNVSPLLLLPCTLVL